MGQIERLGESRAAELSRDVMDQGRSLDLQRRKINHQAVAMETMAGAITQHAADYQKLNERVQELEAELRYRLLPLWKRGQIQALTLWERLCGRFA